MEKEAIERINELARLKKTRELTDEETAERDRLRKAYVASWREAARQTLENTVIEYPDGSRAPLRKLDKHS